MQVKSPMAGVLLSMCVEVGARVSEEDVVAVLESMKMEVPVQAGVAGTVVQVPLAPGAFVQEEEVLAVIE